MDDQSAQEVRRSWPWVKILLALSLSLNLLVVGFVAGAFARQHDGGPSERRAPGLGAFGMPYMTALPRAERRDVFRNMRSSARGDIPDRQARRALFDEVLTVLRARPFDPAALQATVEKQAGVSVSVQQHAQRAWLNVVAGMTDDARAAYADAVAETLRRGAKQR